MKIELPRILLLAGCLVAAACGSPEAEGASAAEIDAMLAESGQPLPTVLVYKSPSCGCCNGWVEHMREAGFEVDARNVADMMTVKRDARVPVDLSSCHTAIIDGYAVEGHVPADQVKRLLAERPEVLGIAAPGMPVGSPGMEGPGAKPYEVMSFDAQGQTRVYAEIDPR